VGEKGGRKKRGEEGDKRGRKTILCLAADGNASHGLRAEEKEKRKKTKKGKGKKKDMKPFNGLQQGAQHHSGARRIRGQKKRK